MKLDGKALDGSPPRLDPRLAVVLLHGPDVGLAQERAQRLGRTVVPDLADPFRVSELTGDQLREDPRRLAEEAQALCLMGGRRLVRVRLATDACRSALEMLLALPAVEALVLIEADDLPSASKLRQLAEKAPSVAAVACYRDSERDLPGTLRQLTAELGLEVRGQAFAQLLGSLGADHALNRRELEKLALYVGAMGGPVTLEDVRACVGDAAAVAIDDAVYAALLGDPVGLERALGRILGEGASPVRVLRALASVLLVMLRLQVGAAEGVPMATGMARLGWRIHFSTRDRLAAALRRHDVTSLREALEHVQATELRCKSAKAPDALLLRQCLLDMAHAAASAPAGRPAQDRPSPSRHR